MARVREITFEANNGLKAGANLSRVKTYLLDDGKKQAEFYQRPINFKDDSGAWGTIDTVLEETGGEELDGETYDLRNLKNSFRVRLKKNAKAPQRVDVSGKGALVARAVGGNASIATIDGNKATYHEAWDNVDWVRTVLRGRVKSDFILKNASAQNEFRFRLQGIGLTYAMQESGELYWLKDGELVGSFPKPTVRDSSATEDALGRSGVAGPAAQTLDGNELVITVDADWLADPARVFPVILDPTYNVADSGSDGFVYKYGTSYPPTTTTVTDSTDIEVFGARNLSAGTYYVVNGLIRWDTSDIEDTATVTGATFRGYVTRLNDGDARNVTMDWYDFGGTVDAGDYSATALNDALAGTDISTVTATADNDFALIGYETGVVKDGYTGLRLHTDGGQPAGLNRVIFASYDHTTATEPRLIVTLATVPLTVNASATITLSASTTKEAGKSMAATVTYALSTTKAVGKAMAAAVTFTPVTTKAVSKAMAATIIVAATATILRILHQAASATITLSASTVKTLSKAITASITYTPATTKIVSKAMAAAVTLAGVTTKAVGKAVSAAITLAASMTKAVSKAATAGVTLAASMTKKPGKMMAATITYTPTTTKKCAMATTAAITLTAMTAKKAGKAMAATITVTIQRVWGVRGSTSGDFTSRRIVMGSRTPCTETSNGGTSWTETSSGSTSWTETE